MIVLAGHLKSAVQGGCTGKLCGPIHKSSRSPCRLDIERSMDFRHLRTFVAVAELGTVSKAAVALRITQPALSRQIAILNGVPSDPVRSRSGRLSLTGAGEQLLGSCRSLLGSVSAIGEQAQMLQHGDTGVLKIAASPVQIETVFSTFLQPIRTDVIRACR